MTQHKRLIKILIWTIGIFVVVGAIAQILFTRSVSKALAADIPKNIILDYDKLTTNVFLGKITLHGIELHTQIGTLDLESKYAQVSGLHFIPLLQNGDIIISELYLEEPFIRVRNQKKDPKSNNSKDDSPKNINIKKFKVQSGLLEVFRESMDSVHVRIEDVDVMLTEVSMSEQTRTRDIPFTFETYQLETEKGYLDLGPLEFINWRRLHLDSEKGHIQKLVLRSKYNKKELSQKLRIEHDHYDLEVDSLLLKHPDLGFDSGIPKLNLVELHLQRPKFKIYRDKLLPDDTTHKKLYNQTLRDLDFDLQIDSISITEGLVNYQERVEADVVPESLRFTDVSAIILNLHSKGSGKVTVDVKAQLMGDGPLNLDWSFNPMHISNEFLVTGSLSNFDSANINPFFRTNMNAEVKGTINQMYFTFSGHETESQGDMKINYDEFEFVVLKKNGLGVNKLLTSVVNLFTKNGNQAEVDGFRYGHFVVHRNTDKSFFNFLWLNIKGGLVETMTGNGKKQ